MLPEAFKRYREHPTLLVLSDTNIFADDPSGQSLAVKHSQKFHCHIFRFQNPEYAEGNLEQHSYGVIEDVEEEAPKAKKPSAKATEKKEVEPEPVTDEDDISANLAEQVKAEEKAAEAKKASSSTTKSGTTGVKAKK